MLSSTNRTRTLGFKLVRALCHLLLVCKVGKYSLGQLFQKRSVNSFYLRLRGASLLVSLFHSLLRLLADRDEDHRGLSTFPASKRACNAPTKRVPISIRAVLLCRSSYFPLSMCIGYVTSSHNGCTLYIYFREFQILQVQVLETSTVSGRSCPDWFNFGSTLASLTSMSSR